LSDENSKSPAIGEGESKVASSSFIHGTDLILATVILALCGILYWVTTGFDEVPEALMAGGGIGPEWFPQLLLILIVGLTLIVPFEHNFHDDGKEGLDSDRKARIKPIAIYSAVLLCSAIGLMPWLGTVLTMVFACIFMPILWGEVRWKAIAIFAVVFPGIVALLFTQVLKVYFEPGILAYIF
jgi:putative tricarboxylic transport membrane protein